MVAVWADPILNLVSSRDPIDRHYVWANEMHPEIVDPMTETYPIRLDDYSPIKTTPYLGFLLRPAVESTRQVTCENVGQDYLLSNKSLVI